MQDALTESGLENPIAEVAPRPSFGRIFFDILETLIFSALLFLAIDAISARIRVDGLSMVPTLKER